MARVISLSMRRAANAGQTDEVPAVLATITHPDLEAPIRLSSDPTARTSLEPLKYGTISRGNTYDFVLMSAIWPDDQHGVPPSTQLVIINVPNEIVPFVRAMDSPTNIDLELVMASSPDDVEDACTGLRIVGSSYSADQLTLDISREPITNEPWPSPRMSKQRFPGLFF